jgi:hypothetical protein
MSWSWHHIVVLLLFFFAGAYAVTKAPQLNLIGRVVG